MPRRRSWPAIISSPAERGLQREGVRVQKVEREGRVGHLGDHRLDLRRQPVRDRPLDVPQVAGADEHDRVAEPGLLDQPRERRQPVLALVAHRLEDAAGAERPPGALQDHLEPALGQRPHRARGDQRAPAVGAAHQGNRNFSPPVAQHPPVRQQHGPVRHRHRQVPLDDQVPGQRRVEHELALDQAAHQGHAEAPRPGRAPPPARPDLGQGLRGARQAGEVEEAVRHADVLGEADRDPGGAQHRGIALAVGAQRVVLGHLDQGRGARRGPWRAAAMPTGWPGHRRGRGRGGRTRPFPRRTGTAGVDGLGRCLRPVLARHVGGRVDQGLVADRGAAPVAGGQAGHRREVPPALSPITPIGPSAPSSAACSAAQARAA